MIANLLASLLGLPDQSRRNMMSESIVLLELGHLNDLRIEPLHRVQHNAATRRRPSCLIGKVLEGACVGRRIFGLCDRLLVADATHHHPSIHPHVDRTLLLGATSGRERVAVERGRLEYHIYGNRVDVSFPLCRRLLQCGLGIRTDHESQVPNLSLLPWHHILWGTQHLSVVIWYLGVRTSPPWNGWPFAI